MKLIRDNRKIRSEFQTHESFEAGIELRGSEVKSIREGKVSLNESYCKFVNGELQIVNMDISQYPPAGGLNHDPKRKRRLLLHRYQLDKIYGKLRGKNMTIVPVRLYLNDKGMIKVEIALASRYTKYDKREKIKNEEIKRKLKRFR